MLMAFEGWLETVHLSSALRALSDVRTLGTAPG